MNKIGRIYLSWRKSEGQRRHIVGLIKKNHEGETSFQYLTRAVDVACDEGFKPYTDFPDTNTVYKDNVLEIFGQRLINYDRADVSTFLDFWDIDPRFVKDTYYMLAHTQGWLPTDNFEFLAEFYPTKGLRFVTDVAGLSKYKIEKGKLSVDNQLQFIKEPSNIHDNKAVLLTKDGTKIGYIKKIHNRLFYLPKSDLLKVRVKAIEENGNIKRLFVEVHS